MHQCGQIHTGRIQLQVDLAFVGSPRGSPGTRAGAVFTVQEVGREAEATQELGLGVCLCV